MLNDRDEKYEGQKNEEDSEYHFADEDVTYEIETETPKSSTAGTGDNLVSRLTKSKRMMISVGVFFVLIFVVYRMVSPTSTAPVTDITAVAPVAQTTGVTQPSVNQQMAAMPAAQPAASVLPSSASNIMPEQSANQTINSMQALPSAPAAMAPSTASSAPSPSQTPAAPMTAQQMPTVASQQLPAAQSVMTPEQVAAQQQAALSGMQTPAGQTAGQMAQQTSTQTSMPTVIPVQTATPVVSSSSGSLVVVDGASDAKATALSADSDKLAGQLQAEYSQKLNDYATQNKAMQDQLQALNTRIATMETELGQLLQALTRQNQDAAPAAPAAGAVPAQPVSAGPDPKISYNVQAIIPGRAWLKSDNGETLTVAEGDTIRDVGRVTKIDPYDGVVEINTGSRVVSLSYGGGG